MKMTYLTMALAFYAASGYAQISSRQKELDSIAKIRRIVELDCTCLQAEHPDCYFPISIPYTWNIQPGDIATMKQYISTSIGPTDGWLITFSSGQTYKHGSVDGRGRAHGIRYRCTAAKTFIVFP